MRRSSLPAWVYLLMVFAAGSALGVVSDRLYTAKTVIANSMSTVPKSPAEFRQRYMEEIRSRLKLTGKQVSEVSQILDHTDKRMQAIHEPEMMAIHKDQVTEVRAILTDRQREEYDQMRKERQKKHEAEEQKQKSRN